MTSLKVYNLRQHGSFEQFTTILKNDFYFTNNHPQKHIEKLIPKNIYNSGDFPKSHVFGMRDVHDNYWVGVFFHGGSGIAYNTKKGSLSFDECAVNISKELDKKRAKWTLSAIAYMDFTDIKSIILAHIHKKWSMWDQSRPLMPWVNTIFHNQCSNLIRNVYSNHSAPCTKCIADEGGELCSLYGTKCNSCPLYAKWAKTKKRIHDIKLPVSIECHDIDFHTEPGDSIDLDKAVDTLTTKLKKILRPNEWKVYKSLFIDGKSEEELAKQLGFKSNEVGRANGYRQIKNIRDAVLRKTKELLAKDSINDW